VVNTASSVVAQTSSILSTSVHKRVVVSLVLLCSIGPGSAQSGGPPHPRADHLPVEAGMPCSVAADQPANAFRVPLTPEQERRAEALYRRSVVILAHDHCLDEGDFRDMETAGITARTIKPTVDGVYWANGLRYRIDSEVEGWFERGKMAFDVLDRRIASSRGKIVQIRETADLERVKRERKLGVIYGLEGARPLEGKIENLEKLYSRGLRELQLFWAVPSPLKGPKGTISVFGLEVIREMNRLGIVIDLSHMGDTAFEQAMETTAKPVVVSHCGVAAASGAKPGGTDQLSDDAIRKIAQNGGAICLHFYEGYIRPRHGEHATVVDLVDHVDHIRRIAGIESVALGADYFPERGWRWIEGAERMPGVPNVAREMIRRGYSDAEIEKVLGLNLMRVYRAVWKK
jgi:membrane dipeptidase